MNCNGLANEYQHLKRVVYLKDVFENAGQTFSQDVLRREAGESIKRLTKLLIA